MGLREIRDKINNAIKDMPEHEGLVKLLSGARKLISNHFIQDKFKKQNSFRHKLLSLPPNNLNFKTN